MEEEQTEQEMKSLMRKNGRSYSLKTDKDRFFFPGEYIKTFDVMKGRQQHTSTCLINTGARINEMRHVQYEDIDPERNRLVLKVTKCKAKKGETRGRPRHIPISSQFSKYLKRYMSRNSSFSGDILGILSTPAFNVGIKKAAKKAGVKDWFNFSAHSLRKTIETWLMSLGVDGLALTAHMGHDMKTAAMHYVSPDVFTFEEKDKMRVIIGDLYRR